jgi:hypothetical protein
MYFYGLIPTTTEAYHPYYRSDYSSIPDAYYKNFLINVTERLQDLKESSIPMKNEIDWLEDTLDAITTVRKPKLILGGDIYNRNNNKDAFHDAVKSVLPILTDGFYLHIWELIYLLLLDLEQQYIKSIEDDNKFVVVNLINETIKCLLHASINPRVYNDYSIASSNIVEDILNRIKFDIYDAYKPYVLKALGDEQNMFLPIHSDVMISTLFNKILPIIMMGFTSYVIYQQAINDPQEDKK